MYRIVHIIHSAKNQSCKYFERLCTRETKQKCQTGNTKLICKQNHKTQISVIFLFPNLCAQRKSKHGPSEQSILHSSCSIDHALTGSASSLRVSRVPRETRAVRLVGRGVAVGVGAARADAAGVQAAAQVALVARGAVAVVVALRAALD